MAPGGISVPIWRWWPWWAHRSSWPALPIWCPHVFINMLVLIPALIWSLYLLYRGLPEALGIPPERGMLMASALVVYLMVAFVSLLGITVALWSGGIGPAIGV